ncbi:MAG: hypothetical protein AVDCRST_MAG73-2536, partial [uncultured Thermomicrobiales bacterium]
WPSGDRRRASGWRPARERRKRNPVSAPSQPTSRGRGPAG